MAKVEIVRPADLSDDKRDEIRTFLEKQWLRAERGRKEQVDGKYDTWTKAYHGIPLEEVRTVPFYKASNFVVKLIRMFLDTFVARSLNIIFDTSPLYIVDLLSKEIRESAEMYLNRKALYDWNHYQLAKKIATWGNKNGTCVVKTTYVTDETWDVNPVAGADAKESKVVTYDGPKSNTIPFEDFYVYPITCTCLKDATIIFERTRYVAEKAQEMVDKGVWKFEKDDLASYLRMPRDVKRTEEESQAGVTDELMEELHLIECHFKYAITNDASKQYEVIALMEESSFELVDLYFNPFPENLCVYTEYIPFPMEDLFYGESMCQLLGQSQEEASRLHNERRDNSMIANTMCFKRRSGSLVPNPSTNWYPGKVWDLEDMTDLETFNIGRNYADMIPQEDYTFQLAEKLSGIGTVMQGQATGNMDRGVYNTMGTIALMQESNQRQDTNIKDVREVLSSVARSSFRLQAIYGQQDPLIECFTDEQKTQVVAALKFMASPKYRYVKFECKASNAGVNKEVERMNLNQTAQIINQYAQEVIQLSTQLMNPQLNQSLRMIMNDIVKMQRWMAQRLLREFDEWDGAELLPNVAAAIESTVPGGSKGTEGAQEASGGPGPNNGTNGGALPPVSKQQLAQLSQMPSLPGSGAGPSNMGPASGSR